MHIETFLCAQEAADLLKVTLSTIYAWVHQRKIPYRKHGKKLVFSSVSLAEWSESREVTPIETLAFPRKPLDAKSERRLKPSDSSLKNKLEIGRAKSPVYKGG